MRIHVHVCAGGHRTASAIFIIPTFYFETGFLTASEAHQLVRLSSGSAKLYYVTECSMYGVAGPHLSICHLSGM